MKRKYFCQKRNINREFDKSEDYLVAADIENIEENRFLSGLMILEVPCLTETCFLYTMKKEKKILPRNGNGL